MANLSRPGGLRYEVSPNPVRRHYSLTSVAVLLLQLGQHGCRSSVSTNNVYQPLRLECGSRYFYKVHLDKNRTGSDRSTVLCDWFSREVGHVLQLLPERCLEHIH